VESLDDLQPADFISYMSELRASIAVLRAVFQPAHLNVEFLGNVEPHLHAHIIPRYVNDPRWGQPIWTTVVGEFPKVLLGEQEMTSIVERLREKLL
jgi:diadenosine tetraphosphate (Ap4A) HIT family hydrolase